MVTSAIFASDHFPPFHSPLMKLDINPRAIASFSEGCSIWYIVIEKYLLSSKIKSFTLHSTTLYRWKRFNHDLSYKFPFYSPLMKLDINPRAIASFYQGCSIWHIVINKYLLSFKIKLFTLHSTTLYR